NRALKKAGGEVAEAGGYIGGRMGFPKTGQAIGVGVGALSLAPEVLAAWNSLQGLYGSQNPLIQGITKTPQEIGQQMNVGEQAAGVSGQLPVRSGMISR